MKISLLDYSKIILEKVSFDANLFQKEFKKAQMRLNFARKARVEIMGRKASIHRYPEILISI